MMIKLPITTQKKDVEIKSVNGQSVFDLREQILTIIGRDVDPVLLRDFFAEPVVNEVKGEVSWYTQASGPLRPFSDLDGDERERVHQTLRKIDGELKASADKVAKAGFQLGWLSDAARAMLSAPDLDKSLFIVGTTLVLTEWGCVPFGSNPSLHQIVVSDKSSPKTSVKDGGIEEQFVAQLQAEPTVRIIEPIEEAIPDLDPEPIVPQETEPMQGLLTEPIAEPDPELTLAASDQRFFNWRDHISSLICLLLLLLLIIGVFLNYRYSDTGRVAAIQMADTRIEQLWGAISQRAQQCQPPAVVPGLDQITPEEVQRGLQQGGVNIGKSLNVSLAWSAPVDLDLAVFEPGGSRINFENPISGTSGKLDIDANRKAGSTCQIVQGRKPVENISWDKPAPSGVYKIAVNLFSLCAVPSTANVIPFKLIITRAGQPAKEISGEVSASAPTFSYGMDFP